MDATRLLVYRFFEFPYALRLDIVRGLNLIEDSDKQYHGMELWRRVLLRAQARGLLEKLRGKIQTMEM